MKHLFLYLLLFCFPLKGYMQIVAPFKWAKMIAGKQYKMPEVVDMKSDDSGNVIIFGVFKDTMDFDPGPAVHNLYSDSGSIFLLKLDSAGTFKWAKNFGNVNGSFSAFHIDNEYNIFIGGVSAGGMDFDPGPDVVSISAYDAFIMKWKPDGNLSWVRDLRRLYADPSGRGVHISGINSDHSGNAYIIGGYCGDVDLDPGPLVRKFSCGDCVSAGGTYIVKLDKNGNLVQAKSLTGPNGAWLGPFYLWGNQIGLDSKNNIYYLTAFKGSVDFDPGPTDSVLSTAPGTVETVLCKLDSSFNLKRIRRQIVPGGLVIDDRDNIFLFGRFDHSINLDPWKTGYTLYAPTGETWNDLIMKLDTAGVFQWGKGISGGPVHGYSYFISGLEIDSRGDLYRVTMVKDSALLYDRTSKHLIVKAAKPGIALLKIGNAGNLKGGKMVLDSNELLIYPHLDVDPKGNVLLAGNFTDTLDADPDAGKELLISKWMYSLFAIKLGQTIPVSLNAFSQPEHCSIFPNPTKGRVTLIIEGFKDQARIAVFNLSGKRLHAQATNESQAELDLNDYPAGIYLIEVSDGERKAYAKVMKE